MGGSNAHLNAVGCKSTTYLSSTRFTGYNNALISFLAAHFFVGVVAYCEYVWRGYGMGALVLVMVDFSVVVNWEDFVGIYGYQHGTDVGLKN